MVITPNKGEAILAGPDIPLSFYLLFYDLRNSHLLQNRLNNNQIYQENSQTGCLSNLFNLIN